MTPDGQTIWRYQERAFKYARMKYPGGNIEDAKDFASWITTKRLEGATGTLGQLYVDFLRQEYGRTGKSRPSRSAEKKRQSRVVMEYDSGQHADPKKTDISSYISCFHGIERAILTLCYKWEFNEAEIADCFGVTESRICQRLKGIQSRLRQRIEKEESRVSRAAESLQPRVSETYGELLEFRTDSKMAREESRAMAGTYAACFEEWLT